MKKRRPKKKTAAVVTGISSNLEKVQKNSELAAAVPATSREAAAPKPSTAKVWKWARRVVLGYDRNP